MAAWCGVAAAAESAPVHFDVHEYRVLGNTVLAIPDVERVLYPLLGDGKTMADVEAARGALEQSYHARGFGTVFVDIPPQSIDEGIVRLRVTEGKINRTRIDGARYFSEREILADLPAATTGTVPNLPALQQQLDAVNTQTPDRSVVPVLKAGALPGTVDLAFKVNDHLPLHASVELNNQYTPDTRPLRATLALSYSNLFGHLDNFAAQYQTSPQEPSQVGVFAANYAWRPLASGLRPSMYFIDSNSDVATIGTIGVLGKGQMLGARLSYPLVTDASTQSLTLGVDYKHFRETIDLDAATKLATPISYINLSMGYAGSWRSDARQYSFNASANFGPRALPNDADGFANKRFKGRPNYFYLRLDGSYGTALPWDFSLNLRLAGQYAVEPLISNENFSIAGVDGVRGFLEAEELGDQAIKGSVQLQSPPLRWRGTLLGDTFVFYDAGLVSMIDPLPGQSAHTVLRSWGAGLDVLPGRSITGSLVWADPLVDGPRTPQGEARFLFLVRGSF